MHFKERAETRSGCHLCPHSCGADRDNGEKGYCGASSNTNTVKLARATLHKWEEPCLSGGEEAPEDRRGSGAVFFSCCPLSCVFCQNREISSECFGVEISATRLAEIFLSLQAEGAYNINLVSPTPYTYAIIDAVSRARELGLTLPIVWNSSGFETVDTISLLENTVDIWLPDFKYYSSTLGEVYSKVRDYYEYARTSISEMVKQKPSVSFDKEGIMTSGVLVRHLLLPTHSQDSKSVINYLYGSYGDSIYISIMRQYTPFGDLTEFPQLMRRITEAEYDEVVDYAIALGVENGFLQEGDSAEESFIPPFDLTGIPTG